MADRVITNQTKEVPEFPEALGDLLLYALNRGKKELETNREIVPFTVLAVGEQAFIEQHPGNSPQECYAAAEHTVKGARGAAAYTFCYDGYLDTNQGTKDAIIAEGGVPGEPIGYAMGLQYSIEGEGEYKFADNPEYIGEAPNFMKDLTEEVPEMTYQSMQSDEFIDELLDGEKPDESTIEKGEELERENAEEFGEPVKE